MRFTNTFVDLSVMGLNALLTNNEFNITYLILILSQVHSSVRGYVWRGKFYGTVITPEDTLHVEPLAHTGPVNTR